ncbi:MAG TPA: selenide, water dikinase SelD, partial [Verrucomicrobiae bacterium]
MKINLAKRREVMERSMRLGHCICEPQRPCPCDVFREQGICPCAGERPDPVDVSQIRLTALVRNAGCASKIAPADLEAVLKRLPTVQDPAVLSGLAAADDAAIYRLADGLCLAQTVDVFTPCVDDPHLFGRICAANCLSDVYAMGGEPRTALSIVAFPSETMPGEVMYRMLAGAMETLAQAGVALIGGHSIKDNEIKLGFAITGVIDPALAEALDRPRVDDVLVLTKPLGTGVLAFAQQVGRGH